MLFSTLVKESYNSIKEADNEELQTAIENVIVTKKLDKKKRASDISDDNFREAVQLVKDAVKNKFTEKEIKNALAKELFNMLPESETKSSKNKQLKESDNDWEPYDVVIGFHDLIGVENEYTINARSKQEAVDYALDQPGSEAELDLSVENIEDDGDGQYTVTVNFAGCIGSDEDYTVYAENEEEAELLALEEAKNDLEVISVNGEDFVYECDSRKQIRKRPIKESHKLAESDKPFNRVMERWYDEDVDILPTQYADSYHDVLESMQEVKEYNYRQDYWGTADEYQEKAENLMRDIEPYIGQEIEYDTEDGTIKIKVLGVDIDKQYNGHLAVRVDILEEPIHEAEERITKESFLNSTITVYDIADYVEHLVIGTSSVPYTTHMGRKRAILQDVNGKYIIADYEAVRDIADSLDSDVKIEVSKKPEEGSRTIPIFPEGTINLSVRELMEAPSEQMKAEDFFTKHNYNERCARNFAGLIKNLNGEY